MVISKHKKKIKKVAVLTSGGDAPGMNAAIRSVVRSAIFYGIEVLGVERGYEGLLDGHLKIFEAGGVANIIQRGGTILKTSRCLLFKQKSQRKKAVNFLKENNIDGLICIGGDGTFRGAEALWGEHKFPVVGIPGTIDNDLFGTDMTIGFDTAINTGLHAIDQIRDTANSHDRIFIIEVMGRNSGYIAMDVGIGGGADAIVVPEKKTTTKEIAAQIQKGIDRGKTSSIIVVAEGKVSGNSLKLAKELDEKYNFPAKVCILGHVQRGGSPSAKDRRIAGLFGAMAVKELIKGNSCFMTGLDGQRLKMVSLKDAINNKKKIHTDLLELSKTLS